MRRHLNRYYPEGWAWSSYRWYALGESGAVAVNEGWREIQIPVRV